MEKRLLSISGLTALDFIQDFDEWIDSGYFTEDIEARLKGMYLAALQYFSFLWGGGGGGGGGSQFQIKFTYQSQPCNRPIREAACGVICTIFAQLQQYSIFIDKFGKFIKANILHRISY